MKVLLDEDVPQLLRLELPDHDVVTVSYAGWSGVLLNVAALAGSDCDRDIERQQNVRNLPLAVIVLAVGEHAPGFHSASG